MANVRDVILDLFPKGDPTIVDYICGCLEDEDFTFGDGGESAYETVGPFLVRHRLLDNYSLILGGKTWVPYLLHAAADLLELWHYQCHAMSKPCRAMHHAKMPRLLLKLNFITIALHIKHLTCQLDLGLITRRSTEGAAAARRMPGRRARSLPGAWRVRLREIDRLVPMGLAVELMGKFNLPAWHAAR